MNKEQILQIAERDPRVAEALGRLEQEVGDMPITSEGLQELIEFLEAALQRPEAYAALRAAAVADGVADAEDLPERFDPVLITALLALMYKLQGQVGRQGFARGGLAQLTTAGRGGDTMLAHINPREAALLKARGGAGSINPRTGLPEYSFLKKLVKVALPIAAAFLVPVLAPAVGTALGIGATAATALTGAAVGGLSSAAAGGDWKRGALMGGLGAGLGSAAGSAANSALGLNLGQAGQNILGGAIVGGVGGAATGQGALRGALQGAAGQALGGQLGQLGGSLGGQLGAGAAQGAQTFGNALTAGYSGREAAAMGGLSGLAAGFAKPSQAALSKLQAEQTFAESYSPDGSPGTMKMPSEFAPGEPALNPETGKPYYPGGAQLGSAPSGTLPAPATAAPAAGGSPLGMAGKALAGVSLLGGLKSAPAAAQQEVRKLSAEQQEYFNRPNVTWDWNRMGADAARAGMPLSQFMAENWPRLTGYSQQEAPDARKGEYVTPPPPGLARGGALSNVAYLARGAGTGRSDEIDARLSDGEYVMDAETVSLLGDGSTKAGAQKLDAMRAALRKHKGRELARGKFSNNAKSPLAYLKGVM